MRAAAEEEAAAKKDAPENPSQEAAATETETEFVWNTQGFMLKTKTIPRLFL